MVTPAGVTISPALTPPGPFFLWSINSVILKYSKLQNKSKITPFSQRINQELKALARGDALLDASAFLCPFVPF
ncbi:hypothetical protein J8J40_33640, partial [Mycobacterium tuberculosis]|nr:hypothetical protein [Mycobacterium tuberculosis]